MITEKQKTITEQAVYGDLAIRDKDCFTPNYEIVKGFAIEHNHFCIETNFEGSRILTESDQIILRPLDLTKEISHKGYNNDQPFIPLVELAKIIKPNFKSYELNVSNQEVLCLIEGHSRRYELYLFDSKEILLEESDLLNRLHFDIRGLIPLNEAISTDEVNPYEV